MPEGSGEHSCVNCGIRLLKNKQDKPLCFTKPCAESELNVPEVNYFLDLFRMLKSDVFKRQPLELLDRARALDIDYDVFAFMEGAVQEANLEMRRAAAR